MENENFTEHLKYYLTDEEKADVAQKLARAVSDQRQAEAELKSVTIQIKSTIQQNEGIISESAEKIRSGYEMRPIECTREFDSELKTVREFRDDTFQTLRERPMNANEKSRLL